MVSTELLEWCISQVESIAKERSITFKTDIQPIAMLGAEDHFKMLFVNLLTNAVIYSHRNGQVNVSCKPGPNLEPVVIIEDDGIGIPTDKLPRIFEEHYRTNEAVEHNKESSGLGLAIVKKIVDLHKGSIDVHSHLGEGTTFTISIPKQVP